MTRSKDERRRRSVPNGSYKNFSRLCIALDAFFLRYRRWPTLLRVGPGEFDDLVNHVFSPKAWARIEEKLRVVVDARPGLAVEDGPDCFRYGKEEVPSGEPPAPGGEEWLGVSPDVPENGEEQTTRLPRNPGTFSESFQALERAFSALAERDGDIYLPNFAPKGPVDYMLIGMEPSLGAWASSPTDARAKIGAGFRNFMWSLEDFILHTSVRRYLCAPWQTYHITDISKGAMPVEKANQDRTTRYADWFDLLVQELELVAEPHTRVIPVGGAVAKSLRDLRFPRPLEDRILHYSGQAGRARRAAVAGREDELLAFASSVTLESIVQEASVTLRENDIPMSLIDATLARLRRARLTASRLRLLFAYKHAFEAIKRRKPDAQAFPLRPQSGTRI
jgi:hypothetical protein